MRPENGRNIRRTKARTVYVRSLADLHHCDARAKRLRELVRGLESELGGADQLSVAQREVVKRAAFSGALAEDLEMRWMQGEPIELRNYETLVKTQLRLLETIGIEPPADNARRRAEVEAASDEVTRRIMASLS